MKNYDLPYWSKRDLMLKSTSDKILDEMLRHMSNGALLIKVVMNLHNGFSVKDKKRKR